MSPAMASAVVAVRATSARPVRVVQACSALLLLVCAFAVVSTSSASAATGGLVGAWNFDETSGTAVKDLSGNGNDGKTTSVTRVAGKYGQALSFNGASSIVTVNDAASLRLSRAATVEAWVKPTTVTGWRTVVLKEQSETLSYGLYSSNEDNRPAGHVFTSRDAGVASSSVLAPNTWAYLAATWDGTTQTIYVNGTKIATAALKGTIAPSSKPLRFGGNKIWNEWFKGAIDDIRIYNRALTAAEVKSDQATAVSSLAAPLPPVTLPIPPLPPLPRAESYRPDRARTDARRRHRPDADAPTPDPDAYAHADSDVDAHAVAHSAPTPRRPRSRSPGAGVPQGLIVSARTADHRSRSAGTRRPTTSASRATGSTTARRSRGRPAS